METPTKVATPAPEPSFFINRNFSLLWIGQAISDLGDVIYLITLSLWIATIIARNQPWAPAAVSGVMIATALPTLILGLNGRTPGNASRRHSRYSVRHELWHL